MRTNFMRKNIPPWSNSPTGEPRLDLFVIRRAYRQRAGTAERHQHRLCNGYVTMKTFVIFATCMLALMVADALMLLHAI